MSPEVTEFLLNAVKIVAGMLATAVVPTLLRIASKLGALLIEQRKSNEILKEFIDLSNKRHEQSSTRIDGLEIRLAKIEGRLG